MTGQRVSSSWLADVKAADSAWLDAFEKRTERTERLPTTDELRIAQMRLSVALWNNRAELLAAAEAIERVRQIHRPESDGTGRRVCSSCLAYTSPMPARIDWPCRTVRALEGATDAD